MSGVVSVCAQVLPFLAPVAVLLVWWRLPGGAKARFGLLAVVSGVCAAALVLVAGLVHDDPRPFVLDPSHPALFPHDADNGFPSDHTTYAATAALVVATVRRRLGLLLLGSAVLGGLARVAANVHHVQDIVAALVIAAVAVGVGLGLQALLDRGRRGRDVADPETPARARP
ncbi:MAG: phosphatase PAP2 family protein [Lapillicoccus sp.]